MPVGRKNTPFNTEPKKEPENNELLPIKDLIGSHPEFLTTKNDSGDTLLHIAARNNDVGTIIMVLTNPNFKEEYLDIENNSKETPKSLLKQKHLNFYDKFKKLPKKDIVSHTKRDKKPPTLPTGDKQIADLESAIEKNDSKKIKELLSYNATLFFVENNDGNNPLHIAARHNDAETLKSVLSYFKPIYKDALTTKNKDGDTPLHIAARNNNASVMGVLYNFVIPEYKDTLTTKNDSGDTPIDIATKNGNMKKIIIGDIYKLDENVINFQDPNGNSIPHLMILSQGNDPDYINIFIQRGFNVNLKNNHGDTPLHLAINQKNLEIANLLIDKDAKLDLQNIDGDTPLHLICNLDNVDGPIILEKMIKKCKNLNIQNKRKDTPLHIATMLGNKDAVDVLLDPIQTSTSTPTPKSDPNLKNAKGDTPLHIAANNNNIDIVDLLLSSKANPCIENDQRKFPYEVATDKTIKKSLSKDCKHSNILSILGRFGTRRSLRKTQRTHRRRTHRRRTLRKTRPRARKSLRKLRSRRVRSNTK